MPIGGGVIPTHEKKAILGLDLSSTKIGSCHKADYKRWKVLVLAKPYETRQEFQVELDLDGKYLINLAAGTGPTRAY